MGVERINNVESERVILVVVQDKSPARNGSAFLYLEELQGLAEAAGGQVAAVVLQPRDRPHPATYIGKGKLEELGNLIIELEPDILVFGHDLTPGQLRNLGEIFSINIVDRTMLILDIFSQRARSREGKLQVELASLEYRLPRLIGKGKELSRTGGGIGARGLGEQRLELDRRYIRRRVQDIKQLLASVEKNRQLQRKRRLRSGIKTVSLVGYTNEGKSTLFNTLCEKAHSSGAAQVEADDRLFQTLDTTTRRISLHGLDFLITDTVGFIQNLPPHLVAAFRSTLEEAVQADLLLHVVDVSDPDYLDKMLVVEQVLESLGADKENILVVFNKADLLGGGVPAGGAPQVSARTGQGIEHLISQVIDIMSRKVNQPH